MTLRTLRPALMLLRLVPPRHLAASCALLIGLSGVEGAGVLLLLPLLSLVGVESGGGTDGIAAAVAAAFGAIGLRPTLGAILMLYVAIVALQSLLQRWQSLTAARIELQVVNALRRRFYSAVCRVRWEFFLKHRSSDFLHLLTGEMGRIGSAAHYAVGLCIAAATAGVYLALAFYMSPLVTSLVGAMGLVLAFATRARMDRTRVLGERLSSVVAALYSAIGEHLMNMKTVKAYGAEPGQFEAFDRLSSETRDVRMAATVEQGRFRQVMAVGSTACLAIVVYVSFGLLAVPAAELLVLLFLFARLMPRLTGLHETAQALAGDIPAFERMLEMEQQCLREGGSPVAAVAAVAAVAGDEISLRREIRIEGVTFRYQDQIRPAVTDLNLTIAARSTTAIVGPSGAGKSTIADLLLGLLVPAEGRILADGKPVTVESLAAWRRQIGYVPQETLLFHATVRENLLWACPGATDTDIHEALRLAAADAFVAAMPRGLDTVVGDRGVLMSGGERQRLSLARALLRRPSLLILDEATSSLDSESEARIQQAIDELHARITIVVITHRLSTIRHADLVYVVDGGSVVESGTWQKLTSRPGGRFMDLCRLQGVDVRFRRPAPQAV